MTDKELFHEIVKGIGEYSGHNSTCPWLMRNVRTHEFDQECSCGYKEFQLLLSKYVKRLERKITNDLRRKDC